jgi:hypothetical protein
MLFIINIPEIDVITGINCFYWYIYELVILRKSKMNRFIRLTTIYGTFSLRFLLKIYSLFSIISQPLLAIVAKNNYHEAFLFKVRG